MTVVEFLTARLDEDEVVAKAASEGGSMLWWSWEVGRSRNYRLLRTVKDVGRAAENASDVTPEFAAHCARHDPARVLAEVAAKRQILAAAIEYSPELANGDNGEWAFDTVLRLLALPYSGHPDCQQEWKPL